MLICHDEFEVVLTTQFAPHSVSAAAIRANPFAGIHDFAITTYPYCQLVIVDSAIPLNCLTVLGSSGILDIPAVIRSVFITFKAHPSAHVVHDVGNCPLSI